MKHDSHFDPSQFSYWLDALVIALFCPLVMCQDARELGIRKVRASAWNIDCKEQGQENRTDPFELTAF